MKVVILAGGMGTRIGEETQIRPKPMVEIGEMPILWHIMKVYSHFGFDDFVICLGHKGWVIKEFFSHYYLYMSDITFDFSNNNRKEVHQNIAESWRVTLVDTGHMSNTAERIMRIKDHVQCEPFMLTYGDGLADIDLNALLAQHKANKKMLTVTAVRPGGRFGVLNLDEDSDAVVSFEEKPVEDGGWINGGFMVAEPNVFDHIDTSQMFEQSTMKRLGREGHLGAYRHTGFWQCMDTLKDKLLLEGYWSSGQAPWKFWD